MKKYLLIKADTNDADYITSRHEVSDEEIELIKPVVAAIKAYDDDKSIKYQKWNWWAIDGRDRPSPEQLYVETGQCTQEQMDYFNDLRPHGEDGIHTIESVEILIVADEIKLL